MAFTIQARLRTLSLILLFITVAFTKDCKKLDACRCEMTDGSGIIDLNGINNKDGSPKFTGIRDSGSASYKYSYNPCTTITTLTDACKGTNLCQKDSTGAYYPCGLAGPTFTVDSSNGVVLTYKEQTYLGYTRSTRITLVCDPSNVKGSIDGIKQIVGSSSSVYVGTLNAKSGCPVSSSESAGLSTGSILLIVFFIVLVLYLIVGIIVNVKVKNKQSIPEVFPNHEFWADCPFLVKDGCIFTFLKVKSCCSFLCAKARGESYAEI